MIVPADSILIQTGYVGNHETHGTMMENYLNHIQLSEEDITGIAKYQKKMVINSTDIKQFLQDAKDFKKKSKINNILYARSYVVKGHGKAIVCAVGNNT